MAVFLFHIVVIISYIISHTIFALTQHTSKYRQIHHSEVFAVMPYKNIYARICVRHDCVSDGNPEASWFAWGSVQLKIVDDYKFLLRYDLLLPWNIISMAKQPGTLGPLLHGLTYIPAWISNHIPSKMWDENTYPFPNFNGATVEVW